MGRPDLAQQRAWLGLKLAVAYMSFCAVFFVVFRHQLIDMFIEGNTPAEQRALLIGLGARFLIAAFMAETASKETYESLMRVEVFTPLGMTSAGFGRPPIGQPAGHNHGRVAVPRDVNPDFFAPAGNIYLSLDDWARFCIDQLRGANGKGALLKPETYSVTQSPPPGAPVSMGWFVRDSIAGLPGPVYYHEGSDGAWFAVVALFPNSGSGVLAVTNVGRDMGGRELVLDAARNAAELLAD